MPIDNASAAADHLTLVLDREPPLSLDSSGIYNKAVDVSPVPAVWSPPESLESPVCVGTVVRVRLDRSASVPLNVEVQVPDVGPDAIPMV